VGEEERVKARFLNHVRHAPSPEIQASLEDVVLSNSDKTKKRLALLER
jgi:hypothetical protein